MGSALKDVGQVAESALPIIGAGAGAMIGGPAGASLGMGLGSAVEGAIGGIQSSNSAKSYEEQQQAALQADNAARSQFMNRENALYGPMRQQMFQEAASPYPLNYGPTMGNINTQALGAQQRLAGNMASRGMGGSGLEASGLQGIETSRVGELSKAFQQGMNARTQLGMNLLQGYNPTQEAQFGQGGLPYQMSFGGAQQGIYNQGMQQGMGALGPGLAGALNAYKGMQQSQQDQPGGTSWGMGSANENNSPTISGGGVDQFNFGQSLQPSMVQAGPMLPGWDSGQGAQGLSSDSAGSYDMMSSLMSGTPGLNLMSGTAAGT